MALWLIAGLGTKMEASDIAAHATGDFIVEVAAAPARLRLQATPAPHPNSGGWTFKRLTSNEPQALLPTISKVPAITPAAKEWLIATPPPVALSRQLQKSNLTPIRVGDAWNKAYLQLTHESRAKSPLPLAVAASNDGMTVTAIEPNIVFDSPKLETSIPAAAPSPGLRATLALKPDAQISNKPIPVWPSKPDFGWYLGGEGTAGYSQLKAARDRVEKRYGTSPQPVTIAHLDTGYDPRNATLPLNFSTDLSATLSRNGAVTIGGGVATEPHGVGTLGLLAGRWVRVKDLNGKQIIYDDFLGGAPGAHVFSVNISAGSDLNLKVVHLATAPMAAGILYAIKNHADVITISAGGIPSAFWAYAVNTAYENGVPIFAASGDFFTFPFFGFPVSPHQTVYPAAFARVEAVTGVTASFRPYALRGSFASYLPWNWFVDLMRGNFGPPLAMGHAIAAYAPNVPWAQVTAAKDDNRIGVNGSGTSATTPQVAAAAALWIAYHHQDLQNVQGWKRAQIVYDALENSAGDRHYSAFDRSNFIGAGTLQADAALNQFRIPEDGRKRPLAVANLEWIWLLIPGDEPGVLRQVSPGFIGQSIDKNVLDKMLGLEASQLIARSKELQALAYANGFGDPRTKPNDNSLRSLAAAVSEDPDCSQTLQRMLQARIKQN